jgi:hypothetical protein
MVLLKYFFILLLLIKFTLNLNIDDFGTRPNEDSYDAAIINGKAIFNAINTANSGSDRAVVIDGNGGKTYTMIPAGTNHNLVNITIQIDGRVNGFDGNQSKWPIVPGGTGIAMFSLENTTNLVIKGNGIVDGNGYNWWWTVWLTGYDVRPNIFDIANGVNTSMEGISVFNAPQYNINLANQLNCTVQNLLIHVKVSDEDPILDWLPTFPLNTDGINLLLT